MRWVIDDGWKASAAIANKAIRQVVSVMDSFIVNVLDVVEWWGRRESSCVHKDIRYKGCFLLSSFVRV